MISHGQEKFVFHLFHARMMTISPLFVMCCPKVTHGVLLTNTWIVHPFKLGQLWDMRSGSCAHQLQGLHTDQVGARQPKGK